MGNFTSCCKINDNEINIDDTKLHNSKSQNNSKKKKIKKNDFRTSVGPPVIVERTVDDEHHYQINHDLVPYLN